MNHADCSQLTIRTLFRWSAFGLVAGYAMAAVVWGDPPAAGAKPAVKPADNSYCLVCHVNFKAEEMSKTHQKAGVGCMKCHGESDVHSADEDGLTAPQIMYAKEKINPACIQCHAEEKLKTNKDHAVAFEKDPAKLKSCTACHGEHRMATRTRRWDKNTGKLLEAKGVRMMQKDSPATSAR